MDAGNPFAARGPFMHQEPDQLDAEQWRLLQAVTASTDRGVGIDESLSAIDREAIFDTGFLDPSWDEFPGIPFARAVEHTNTLVLPGDVSASFAVGHLAVTSVGEGHSFLRALLEHLSLSMAVLEEEYDPEMSDDLNGVLYNPRLLAFHLGGVARSGRPLGIWG